MVSTDLTEQAAAGLVRNHGFGALAILAGRAELAEELGHRVAAETWRGIADAAARLLRMEKSHRDLAWSAHPPGTMQRGSGEDTVAGGTE